MKTSNVKPHSDEAIEWIALEEDHGKEVIDFVQEKIAQKAPSESPPSKKSIKKVIDQGGCSINGRLVRKSNFLLARKDRVLFQVHFLSLKRETQEVLSSRILYRDSGIIAISKPSYVETAEKPIRDLLIRKSKLFSDKDSLFLVHRLDQNTSGVLLLTENLECQKMVEALFKERKVEKTYIAVVEGSIKEKGGVISVPLVRETQHGSKEIYVRAAASHEIHEPYALSAVTKWKTLIATDQATLVAVFPQTGRTHQIRAHFAYIGHPLLGDVRYQSSQKRIGQDTRPPRHLLHAFSLKFQHPITNKSVVVYDHVHEDMRVYVERLFGPIGERLICEL